MNYANNINAGDEDSYYITDTHYIILPKTRTGYGEWFNIFAIADKADINKDGKRDDFIDFLKLNCNKLKI